MSLNGALIIGASALSTSQAALQVTGNNISNVGNPNYSREVGVIADTPSEQLRPGEFIGTGVDLSAIQRQVDESLNSRLNSAMSDNSAASITQQWSGQIESVFNALGSQSLDSQLTNFVGDWSQLGNNPTDTSQRQVVIQDGQTLAQQFNGLSAQLSTMQTNLGSQLTSLATNASQLAQQIAGLNQQISTSQGPAGGNNQLLDQRDAAVQQLSKLVNVQTVNQGNGTVNVYIGSEPLVISTTADSIQVQQNQVNGQPSITGLRLEQRPRPGDQRPDRRDARLADPNQQRSAAIEFAGRRTRLRTQLHLLQRPGPQWLFIRHRYGPGARPDRGPEQRRPPVSHSSLSTAASSSPPPTSKPVSPAAHSSR